MVRFSAVTDAAAISEVAQLARIIWSEHYLALIGAAQTEYMLTHIQSAEAIGLQVQQGYRYYLVHTEQGAVGYFAWLAKGPTTLLLSKLYLLRTYRGLGYGAAMVAFVEAFCREHAYTELYLTVNRHNQGSIAFYQAVGFRLDGVLQQAIGNGFVMDDYKMVKQLA